MLVIIIAAAISHKLFAMACLLVAYVVFYLATTILKSGSDFYFSLLLGFLIPGGGVSYLGERRKGCRWFLLQILAFVASTFLKAATIIEEKYLGLIIFAPWIAQLLDTALVYKDKFGDIDTF